MTTEELRERARKRAIDGYAAMTEAELVAAIAEADAKKITATPATVAVIMPEPEVPANEEPEADSDEPEDETVETVALPADGPEGFPGAAELGIEVVDDGDDEPEE